MPASFQKLTLDEFAELLRQFPFTRTINAVHMHHTWRPNHGQFRGHDSIVAMWRYHTQEKGWIDIAQHITIDPEGFIWTGRNWNVSPVSASGHNGNRVAGPFMFEMIGDFDTGRDPFEGSQRDTALNVVALVQRQFRLPPESLRFHNQMAPKTCPGNALAYARIIEEVRSLHAAVDSIGRRAVTEVPFGPEHTEAQGSLAADRVRGLIAALSGEVGGRLDPADAELPEEAMTVAEENRLLAGEPAGRGPLGTPRSPELPPQLLEELRPYVVNLNQGRFSREGRYQTSKEDVDAIFESHLPRALAGARARNAPLRIVFYAHGGLVSESNGLAIAQHHVRWWQRNHVYPIYFVWETGFFETLRQLLSRSRELVREAVPRELRDLWDWTTDPAIEVLTRALQGPRLWSGMKRSAELAVAKDGGARYVAERLQDFCHAQANEVQLHAVGHSAGSIFHAHFLPTALDLGVPPFTSAHLLAPALRVDEFHQRLAGHVGQDKGLQQLTVFTMNKDRELADDCATIYHKSLLYLIYYALEAERKTPILGLEVNLRADPMLKALFGLIGNPANAPGEVVWSTTLVNSGRSASTSTSHGGFDDDAPTMNSVLRRVVGADDNDPIEPYPPEAGARELRSWLDQVDWPEELSTLKVPPCPQPPAATVVPAPPTVAPVPAPTAPTPVTPTAGRKRALCVGINSYPTAPLAGCVADAQAWASALMTLGFERPVMLLDAEATRSAILESLVRLVKESSPGDILVFQYAGHGTTLPDINQDEAAGDTPNDDEAICPFDFASGYFLVDDDIGAVFNQVRPGVNITCFIDCCHSGTITRFAVGLTPGAGSRARGDERSRFLVATPVMIEAHRRFRASMGRRRAAGSGGPDRMPEVLFSACLSSEAAWESGGHGDFTTYATRVLQAGIAGMSNDQFKERVIQAFGPNPRQHPRLYCAPDAARQSLLQSHTGAGVGARSVPVQGIAATPVPQLLRTLASLIEHPGGGTG